MTTFYSKVVFKIVLLCIGHWYISFQHLLAEHQRSGLSYTWALQFINLTLTL